MIPTSTISRLFQFFVLALFISPLPSQAAEKSHTYRVRIPATHRTCDHEARLLAARFWEATGLKTVTGSCVGEVVAPDGGPRYYALLVTYQANRQQLPYTVFFGMPISDTSPEPSGLRGLYATYQDCVSDLPAQAEFYESQTQLLAVASTCEQDSGAGNYRIQIDGFGSPKKRLYVLNAFRGLADESLMAGAAGLVSRHDGHVVKLVDNLIYYYSPRVTPIKHDRFGSFEDPTQCHSQVGSIDEAMTFAGATEMIVDCIPARYTGYLSLEALGNTKRMLMSDYGSRPDAVLYLTFSECLQDRNRVLSQARLDNSRVAGAVCTRNSSLPSERYRVEILSTL